MFKQISKFTAAVAILFFLSLLSIDSDSWMPLIMCVVCWIYLACQAWKNEWFYDPEREDVE